MTEWPSTRGVYRRGAQASGLTQDELGDLGAGEEPERDERRSRSGRDVHGAGRRVRRARDELGARRWARVSRRPPGSGMQIWPPCRCPASVRPKIPAGTRRTRAG